MLEHSIGFIGPYKAVGVLSIWFHACSHVTNKIIVLENAFLQTLSVC